MRNTDIQLYRIGALERALQLLAAISEAGEISLALVASQLSIPKGSALRHLRTLERAGYVRMDEQTKRYSLGPALIHLGYAARQRLRVPEVALPALRWLRDRCQETTHLGILSGSDVVHVAVAPCGHPVKMAVPVGERTLFHISALGKSLLAWIDPADLDELVNERGLPRFTDKTLTDIEAFRRELALVRERGWSMDDEESANGLRCVAAPVHDESGRVVAAISVSAPTNRFSRSAAFELAPIVIQVADHVSSQLGWPGDGVRENGWTESAPWTPPSPPSAHTTIKRTWETAG